MSISIRVTPFSSSNYYSSGLPSRDSAGTLSDAGLLGPHDLVQRQTDAASVQTLTQPPPDLSSISPAGFFSDIKRQDAPVYDNRVAIVLLLPWKVVTDDFGQKDPNRR